MKTKATKQFQADLKKYADYTGVPDFGIYTGYVDCDLAIIGLKQQGKNLDRSTYADDLRKLGNLKPASLDARRSTYVETTVSRPRGTAPRRPRSRTASSRPQAQERQESVLDRQAHRSVAHR